MSGPAWTPCSDTATLIWQVLTGVASFTGTPETKSSSAGLSGARAAAKTISAVRQKFSCAPGLVRRCSAWAMARVVN